VGVDTHLYLLDFVRYTTEVKPLLDELLNGGAPEQARIALTDASKLLAEAHDRREYPWTPFHRGSGVEKGLATLDGRIPRTYEGDRASLGLLDPDEVTQDPRLVREYYLRDDVCRAIVEGLCVPWDLEFPPVHVVTWTLGADLYKRSKRFEGSA
jgi:hypothetical protein